MLPKGFDHNTEERKGKKEIQKGVDGTEQYLHRERKYRRGDRQNRTEQWITK